MGIFIISLFYITLFLIFSAYDFVEYTFFFFNNSTPIKAIIFFSGSLLLLTFLSSSGQRYSSNKSQLFLLILFIPFVYLFVTTNSVLVFFLCYELFLLPSFLIVFFGSPNRRGVVASIYFLMWTQIGSFLVFCGIIYLFLVSNTTTLSLISSNSPIILALFFIGFGIKIPVWPFHYWLTKTHVEAPTYFSIYLSGFLVKTALYGLWVFLQYSTLNTYFSLLLVISIFSVVDSSIKMWSQVDLKKLVAYGTIQEMNLILIAFLFGTANSIKAGGLFIIAHTLLSTIFFLLSDSLYRRFGARTTTTSYGLFQKNHSTAYIIFIACVLFSGLPFTLKFVVEVYIYSQLLNANTIIMLVTLVTCNWIGLVSFNKHWFVTLFGSPSSRIVGESSLRELYIYLILFLFLFLIGFMSFIVI